MTQMMGAELFIACHLYSVLAYVLCVIIWDLWNTKTPHKDKITVSYPDWAVWVMQRTLKRWHISEFAAGKGFVFSCLPLPPSTKKYLS